MLCRCSLLWSCYVSAGCHDPVCPVVSAFAE
uniref:Uncharacterized protein n=1 Tax=Anguilla anguilla TaxID=7936 RepID=A0A0E9PGW4_ANGAN